MKIAILGYGLQGQSVYEYYRGPENQITICDQSLIEDLPEGVDTQLGPSYLRRLDRFDTIFRGPSVHPSDIVAAAGQEILDKVTSNTNEFFKLCPSKNIIGVTGTKGKGTTSTLITKMLEACGFRVHLGGNIGVPPLDLLKRDIKPEDYVVLELANFQLIDLKSSPHIAVCLLVEPEHTDWHSDVEEYYRSKTELFRHQTAKDIAIYYDKDDNSKRIASTSPGRKIPYYESPGALVAGSHITIDGIPVIRLGELKLLGKHNWQNVCAAVTAVWQINKDEEAISRVLKEFSGLPHRLELVRELDSVSFYDDSFATIPSSAIVAIESFKQPKVVILGGSDKRADYKELADVVKANNVRSVVIIGETGMAITKALNDSGYTDILQGGRTMEEIVKTAANAAKPSDVVLLSPACASFDLFDNYVDRGDKFKQAVQALD